MFIRQWFFKVLCQAKRTKISSLLFTACKLWCNHTIRKHNLKNFPHFLVLLVRIVSRYRLQCPQNFSREHIIFSHKIRQCATSLTSVCMLLTVDWPSAASGGGGTENSSLFASAQLGADSDLWSQLELPSLCKNVVISTDWAEVEDAPEFLLCFSPFMCGRLQGAFTYAFYVYHFVTNATHGLVFVAFEFFHPAELCIT